TRRRLLLVLASVATVVRLGTVALLAGSGWWFVQEKVTLAVPLMLAGTVVAWWWRTPIALFTAGFATLGGPVFAVRHGDPAPWAGGLVPVALVGAAPPVTGLVLGAGRLRAAAVASGTALLVGVVLALVAGPSPVDGPTSTDLSTLRGPDSPA